MNGENKVEYCKSTRIASGFMQVSYVTTQVDEVEIMFELRIAIENLTVHSSSNLRVVI